MTGRGRTLDRAYFERLYQQHEDPWHFRTSAYEAAKYDACLAALLRPRYTSALEVGCSIGVFTRRLATRCDRLLALDLSPTALAAARRECADLPHVAFREAAVPAGFPAGDFDLVVLSEVLYYLSASDLAELARCCLDALRPGGEVLLCHWLGRTDYPHGGDDAVETFLTATTDRLRVRFSRREPAYRLEVLAG